MEWKSGISYIFDRSFYIPLYTRTILFFSKIYDNLNSRNAFKKYGSFVSYSSNTDLVIVFNTHRGF